METGNKILPKLPISWNLVRIKNLFSNEEKPLRVGPFGSQLTTKDYLDSGYWVYTQRNVLDNNFATNDIFISDEKYEELKAFAVKENDILITTRGSGTPGHVAKVPHNYKKGILHPCLMRFRLDEDKCLYEYLRFVFEFSTYIREQIDSASNTTAIPVLYSDTLKNLYMPLPSIEEQKEIIEKLITFEKKIDSLIAEKESLINDLEAYKKSLIYEVVTGKRRVV
jgi:type I restriction enzyme S subunit